MKKIILTLVLWILSMTMYAQQSLNLALTQQPCNADGIITATSTGLAAPVTITYYSNGSSPVVHSGVMGATDVLNAYTGAFIYANAVDNNGVSVYGYLNSGGTQGGSPPFTYNVTTAGSICGNPGSALVSVTGGLPPFVYEYTDQSTGLVVATTTTNPTPLPLGNYDLMITDANGCKFGSIYASDSISIYNVNSFNVNYTTTLANCTNGSITITSVTGGTSPYTYSWSNGSVNNSISGLTTGNYAVTVTDATGCVGTNYIDVNQAITINVPITPTPASCLNSNGSAIAFGSGGTPPYSYTWSNGINAQSITGIPAGYYTASVIDNNGCIGSGYTYVSATTPITVTYTNTTSLCTSPTGTATLVVAGGAAPYSIVWNTFPVQYGYTATNLAPGSYSFNITDANGCVQSGTVPILPVSQFNLYTSTTPATCIASNGSASVTVAGGSSPFSYLWSNGSTATSISAMPAGGYGITVVDNMGCSKSTSANIQSYSPVSIGVSTTPTSCIYAQDATASATAYGGTAPYTWGGGSSTMTGLGTGYYSFTTTDANGCYAYHNFTIGSGNGTACYCTIQGTVFNDANGNCVQDGGELGISNIQIHCSGFGYTYTNAAGHYSFQVPTGTYVISESVLALYPLASCQNNLNSINVVASSGCTNTLDFANTIATIHDMKVNVWNWTLPIPGFNYAQKMIVSNMGSVAEPTILGGYEQDAQITSATFAPSTDYVFSTANWYNTILGTGVSLNAGASSSHFVNYLMPTNIPINTMLTFKDSVAASAPMSNWLNDYSPWDNVNYHSTYVVGSYDPNFKEVSPKGVGANGNITSRDSVLDYMVHFQNLGNFQAQNVVVLDTLDNDLDWSTLRPVYQSHPCTITMNDNGVVKFEFKNINLPAKMYDDAGSNGMFSYTIKTKKNLPIGTQFKNSASIYFDFNSPIKTNSTVNTLTQASGTDNVLTSKNETLAVYPNPTKDALYVVLNNIKNEASTQLDIVDLSGKLVYSKRVKLTSGEQEILINIKALTAGVYFVSTKGATTHGVAKFVKIN